MFCPNCGTKNSGCDNGPHVGDYYYTDGTWSTERDANKIVAGIVFTTETTKEEKKHGWTHGQIVALDCLSRLKEKKVRYGPFNLLSRRVPICTDLFEPGSFLTFYRRYEKENINDIRQDRDGFVYTKSEFERRMISIENPQNLFDALGRKNKHSSLPAGKTSGWYVPAAGQIIDLIENLSGETLKWGSYPSRGESSRSIRSNYINYNSTNHIYKIFDDIRNIFTTTYCTMGSYVGYLIADSFSLRRNCKFDRKAQLFFHLNFRPMYRVLPVAAF